MPLNFDALRAVNVRRCVDGFGHTLESWSPAEWTNALCGEAGEAANIAKKMLRHRDQVAGNQGDDTDLSRHTFQILTKRPQRMRDWFGWLGRAVEASRGVFPDDPFGWIARHLVTNRARHFGAPSTVQASGEEWPLPNVWLGVSVEDQATADERIPLLLQAPAAVRFVSYEPALGPVDFGRYYFTTLPGRESREYPFPMLAEEDRTKWVDLLDWIIVGGESGPGARRFNVAWARSTVRQCRAAGVACFYKQGGSSNRCAHSSKGGCFECFPDDLKVREFPRAS